jgi:hypothetical protein
MRNTLARALAIFAGVGLALGLLSLGTWAAKHDWGANSDVLVTVEEVHDFGAVAHGSLLTHRFEIRNSADTPVRLALGPPSCGCTTGLLDRETLPPGASAFLEVSIETAGRQGNFEVGVPLKVAGADTVQTMALRAVADIDPHLGIKPTSVDFGELRRGRGPTTRPVRLILPEGSTLEGTEWVGRTDYAALRWGAPISRSGETEFRGTLELDPDKTSVPSLTQLGAIVHITTRTEDQSTTFQLQVFATVADYVSASPSSIYWDSARLNNKQVIEISAADDSSVTIVGVDSPHPEVLAWDVTGATGPRATISVSLKPHPAATGTIRSELRIQVRSSRVTDVCLVRVPILVI